MTEGRYPVGVEQPPGSRRAIAVVLAAAAGFTDAAGFLALDLFTAHMSGNSARLGVYLGGGLLQRAAPSAFAVAVFLLSIGAGTAAIELLARSGRRSPAAIVLGCEVLFLVALTVAGGAAAVNGRIPQTPARTYYPLAALAVAAMGLQTSTLQRISGQTVRTTYVSGMLTNLVDESIARLLGPADRNNDTGRSYLHDELGMHPGAESNKRIQLIAGIWLGYVGGAVLGGYLERQLQLACLAVPSALIAAIVALEVFGHRTHPGQQSRARPVSRAGQRVTAEGSNAPERSP